jgi:fatty acid desaturase
MSILLPRRGFFPNKIRCNLFDDVCMSLPSPLAMEAGANPASRGANCRLSDATSIEAGEILKRLRGAAHPVQLAGRPAWPTIAAVTFNWVINCGAIFCMSLASWWVHPLLRLIVATRQHPLLVLLHDASHFLLCRSKFWNELISDFFCGLPFGLTTQAYASSLVGVVSVSSPSRSLHLDHHLFPYVPW